MPVTMKEIARASGVSQPTVSLVLSNKGQRYSEATRRAVLDAARRLGYRPNSYAQSIRSGRFNSVALVQSTDKKHSAIFEPLLAGIQDALQDHDLHLTLSRLPDEKLTSEGFVPKILRQLMADGMLIDYITGIPPQMAQLLRETQLPAIWINSKQESDCVYPDDFAAAHDATTHLLSLGHRRIAFAEYSSDKVDSEVHYSLIDRIAGYEAAMKSAGLAPQVMWDGKRVLVNQRLEYSRQWLSRPDRPTAVVANQHAIGVAVLYAAATLGLRPAKELSLVAISNLPKDETGLFMDMRAVPFRELGLAAVEMLLAKIAEPAQLLPPQSIRFREKAGSTCGPLMQ